MVHKHGILTKKESAVQKALMNKFNVIKRKTKKPVIVALVGLVGAGKSSVAKELAVHIGAVCIEGDKIRVELRKCGARFEKTRAIAENIAVEVIKLGGNVILDSDFADEKKRASIRERARKIKTRLIFIRVFCDFDVMTGRVLTAQYRNNDNDFFGGDSSKWKGSQQNRGAVVKIREMWRRTPLHYRWSNQGGGVWILRKFSHAFFAEIDTTVTALWKQKMKGCAKQL